MSATVLNAGDLRVNVINYLTSREKLCGEGFVETLCTFCEIFL